MSKFDSDLAEKLYEVSLDGGIESIGSVDELGWFGLFEDELAILEEDSQGFVGVHEFPNINAVRLNWAVLNKAYENYWAGDEVPA